MLNFRDWFAGQLGDRDDTVEPLKLCNLWSSGAWYAAQQESNKAFIKDIDDAIDKIHRQAIDDYSKKVATNILIGLRDSINIK